MNNVISLKYGLAPEKIEERNLDPNDGKYFKQVYDSVRLRKIQNNQLRNDKYNKKIDRRKRTLRRPLNLTVLVKFLRQLKDLEKKMLQEDYIKVQLKISLFSIEIEFLLFINTQSQTMEHIYIGWKRTAKKLKGDF